MKRRTRVTTWVIVGAVALLVIAGVDALPPRMPKPPPQQRGHRRQRLGDRRWLWKHRTPGSLARASRRGPTPAGVGPIVSAYRGRHALTVEGIPFSFRVDKLGVTGSSPVPPTLASLSGVGYCPAEPGSAAASRR
jgi:hypothetical protein